ncbi:hypothetical protein [Streptacidiphilus sp. ASG 303]|nr:hypothetical protein [Streptacidiphilus sp. ASG 303]MCD0484000.1 hypothetical protein [Streptacidiphilus sp. ASG 303]
MGEHVHVRVNRGLSVTEDGQLVELSRCPCGESWTRSYRPDEGAPER